MLEELQSTLLKHSSFNTRQHLKHHHSLLHVYQNNESIEIVEEFFHDELISLAEAN